MSTDLVWNGKHEFLVVGTRRHEDTLRVTASHQKLEREIELVLPTLCITYADMAFINAIGGPQSNYPDSIAYGPSHFDPPVVLTGPDVERYTWIRGAHRVIIGPAETVIAWLPRRELVIPRLRIDTQKPATARLVVQGVSVPPGQEVTVFVRQFADGRLTGDISVAKRHPDWKPPQEPRTYDLWARLKDGVRHVPMGKVPLKVWRWDDDAGGPGGPGGVAQASTYTTDEHGTIHDATREPNHLEVVTLDQPGWKMVPRCFRPLPAQPVRLALTAWPLKPSEVEYLVGKADTWSTLAQRAGHPESVLRENNGKKAGDEAPVGSKIRLPCWAAMHHGEAGESDDTTAKAYGFRDAAELAARNGKKDLREFAGSIPLPGWSFFHARKGERLEDLDAQFGLPEGSSRTTGRVHRPRAGGLYPGEIVAVPVGGKG